MFHPQSNGMVEPLHRQVKDALRAHQAGVKWLKHLPWVLLAIRAAPKEDSGVSAAEAVFGGQLLDPAGWGCCRSAKWPRRMGLAYPFGPALMWKRLVDTAEQSTVCLCA